MNRHKLYLVCLMAVVVLVPALDAQAIVRYVALDGSGADGQSWATAYKTIEAALNDPLMVGGSEIWVKQGNYAVKEAIEVKKAVRIYGGYSGVDSTRNWSAFRSVINGGTVANHCFRVTGNATIDGFVITQGNGSGWMASGGGIAIVSCAATITNCIFHRNHGGSFGGGLATWVGTGTKVANCTFLENDTTECGAGIYNEGGTGLQIIDCTFTGNGADDSGGGIHNVQCSVTITGCAFQGNRAAQRVLGVGGGILNEESTVTIINCAFRQNRAPYGAGIFNYLSSGSIEGCLFADCDPDAGAGGGMYNSGGAVTVTSCLFKGNRVTNEGGGLFIEGTATKMYNCIFWDNHSTFGGGGIYLGLPKDTTQAKNSQFTNCTFYDNFSGWRGGAVCSESTPSLFVNCILWGNMATDANPSIYSSAGWSAGMPAAKYSDIEAESTYPGVGNLRSDPLFVNPSEGDFSLAFDSPCVDTGNNPAVIGTPRDYEDAVRIADGDENGTAIVDMGALELQRQPDHLKYGQIMRGLMFDSPSDTSADHMFLLRLETDDAPKSIEFRTPDGTSRTIPLTAHTSSGKVDTYHRVQGKTHVWEYWVRSSDPAHLTPFGDGTYRVIAHYRDGSEGETEVTYMEPGMSSTPIPQPAQRPVVQFPGYDAPTPGPVHFAWDACKDGQVNSISLAITDAETGQDGAGEVLSETATASNAHNLKEGKYEARLGFARFHNEKSSDGTPFQYGKAVFVGHQFNVPYTAVFRFWAPGTGRHFYTTKQSEKEKLLTEYADVWTYEGIGYYACSTPVNSRMRPVYRFWSGQSHFYTIDEEEKSKLLKKYASVWTPEGIAFYAYPEGTEPPEARAIYRFWNVSNASHFYTIKESEATKLVRDYPHVFTYEGVAFYAFP